MTRAAIACVNENEWEGKAMKKMSVVALDDGCWAVTALGRVFAEFKSEEEAQQHCKSANAQIAKEEVAMKVAKIKRKKSAFRRAR